MGVSLYQDAFAGATAGFEPVTAVADVVALTLVECCRDVCSDWDGG